MSAEEPVSHKLKHEVLGSSAKHKKGVP